VKNDGQKIEDATQSIDLCEKRLTQEMDNAKNFQQQINQLEESLKQTKEQVEKCQKDIKNKKIGENVKDVAHSENQQPKEKIISKPDWRNFPSTAGSSGKTLAAKLSNLKEDTWDQELGIQNSAQSANENLSQEQSQQDQSPDKVDQEQVQDTEPEQDT